VTRVLFLVGALDRGGAQRQLILLVTGLDRTRFAPSVVTIYDGGVLRAEMASVDNVRVHSLRKAGRWDVLPPLWRLWQIVRNERPAIVHGYMGMANLLALVFGKLAGARTVWGIRASDVDFSFYDRFSAGVFKVSRWLSRFPDLIIVNSHTGLRHHIAHGYRGSRMHVIPNGFDTLRFLPDPEARRRMRSAWGIAEHEPLLGVVARLDPMKDHPTFLHAAAQLAQERPDVRFVCVGDGQTQYRKELQDLANALGLRQRLVWAGEIDDPSAVQNALDIATSSSAFGEGSSNAIGEAMACGVPCVVTAVGDSAILVGATGLIIPPGTPDALVNAWKHLLALSPAERAALGQAARKRIISEYSAERLIQRTETALAGLLAKR
jgi:glycosyltransferase involved in cell wall biosynthesis